LSFHRNCRADGRRALLLDTLKLFEIWALSGPWQLETREGGYEPFCVVGRNDGAFAVLTGNEFSTAYCAIDAIARKAKLGTKLAHVECAPCDFWSNSHGWSAPFRWLNLDNGERQWYSQI
jgi:hypothetical protein